jgi:hypothetical protein
MKMGKNWSRWWQEASVQDREVFCEAKLEAKHGCEEQYAEQRIWLDGGW